MVTEGSSCIFQCMPSTTFQIWFITLCHGPTSSPHDGGHGPASRVRIRTAGGNPLPGLLRGFQEWTVSTSARLSRRVRPPINLRFALRDLHPPHHLHNMTWHENMLHAMHLPLESIRAPFKFHIHAILTPHMRIGLLHAIHAHAHA